MESFLAIGAALSTYEVELMAQNWAIQFYASKAWKTIRREALKRDHYTCRDCYARASEVHHIIGLTLENINDVSIALNPENLVSLCKYCHTKQTKGDTGDLIGGYVFDDEGQVVRAT
jgi:5-methylcytosine-specific restriction endonuclease McrA